MYLMAAQRVAKSAPAGVAAQRFEAPQAFMLPAVPEQPLGLFHSGAQPAPHESVSRFKPQSLHCDAQVFKAHGQMEPVEHTLPSVAATCRRMPATSSPPSDSTVTCASCGTWSMVKKAC